MPKFLNKNELVLLILIILLFDVNGFCAISTPYIINNKGSLFTVILTMIFVLYSTYMYHTISTGYASYPITYTPNDYHSGPPSCDIILSEMATSDNIQISEMKQICEDKPVTLGTLLSEKIVLTSIALILFIFVLVSVFYTENYSNDKLLRAIPTLIMASFLFLFANVYIPYFSGIQY